MTMAPKFDVVFAFKDAFGDNSADIISGLRCHPLIWDHLNKENNYLRIANSLGDNSESWNIKGIIDFLKFNRDDVDTELQKAALLTLLDKITALQCEKEKESLSWKTVFQKVIIDKAPSIGQVREWGTLVSYFMFENAEKAKIESALIQNKNIGPNLFAYLIKIGSVKIDLAFFERHVDLFLIFPGFLLKVCEAISHFGKDDMARQIGQTFFLFFDSKENALDAVSFEQNSDHQAEIQRLIELSALAKATNDYEREKNFSNRAKSLIDEASANLINPEGIDLTSLEHSLALMDSDKENAQKLSIQWLMDLLQNKREHLARLSINDIDRIYSNLISLDLFMDAVHFAEIVTSLKGGNSTLEIKTGEICALKGDQSRAIKFLQPHFGEENLSRELKIKLAQAYAYYHDWQSASRVLRSINDLNVRDALFRILCLTGAESAELLGKQISESLNTFRNSPAIKILKRVYDGEHVFSKEILNIPEVERDYLIFVLYRIINELNKSESLTFLAEIKDFSPFAKILYILTFADSLPRQEISTLFNQLQVPDGVNDQKMIEGLVDLLSEKQIFESCEDILVHYGSRWPLSKIIREAKIIALIHQKKYAEGLLLARALMDYYPIDNKIVTLFGACLLQTNIDGIPISEKLIQIDESDKELFGRMIKEIGDGNLSLENRILKIEILSQSKTNDYLLLGTQPIINNPVSNARILNAIGRHFYQERKFDQAIFYLNEARILSKYHQAGFKMLVDAYCQLRMYENAIEIIKDTYLRDIPDQNDYLLDLSEVLFESQYFIDFLNEKSGYGRSDKQKTLALAKVMALRGYEADSLQILEQLEAEISQRDVALLQISDLYHFSGDNVSSKRVLDAYLSNNHDLGDRTLILAARQYYKLDLSERSLNLLSMVNENEINVDIARANIYVQLGEIELAQEALRKGLQNPYKITINSVLPGKQLPPEWQHLDLAMLEMILLQAIKNDDADLLRCILNSTKNFMQFEPDLITLICNAAQLTGNFSIIEEIIIDEKHNSKNITHQLQLTKISEALFHSHQVNAARLVAEISHELEDNALFELSTARLQVYQADNEEALEIITAKFNKKILAISDQDVHRGLETLVLTINLAEALYEIEEYSSAFALLKILYKAIGFTERLKVCYGKVIGQILMANWIGEKLMIKNHLVKMDEVDREMIRDYEKIESIDDITQQAQSLSFINDLNIEDDFFSAAIKIEDNAKEAIEELNTLLKTDANNPRYLFALGLAYKKIGDYVSSYAPINLALELWPDEILWQKTAKEICEELGDNLNASRHQLQIDTLTGVKELDKLQSYQYIQGLIDSCVFGEAEIPYRDLPALLDYAANLIDWGNFDVASAIIEHILEISPKNLRAKWLFVEIILRQKDYSEAESLLRQFILDEPDNAVFLEYLIDVLISNGAINEARKYISHGSKRDVFAPDRLMILEAKVLDAEEGFERARDFIEESINKNDYSGLLQQAISFFIAHHDFIHPQQYSDLLLEKNSNNPDALFLSGILAREQGDLDRAISFFNRVIIVDPTRTDAYIANARIYETKRQFNSALTLLEEGIKHNPFNFALLKYSGKYFAAKGKNEIAHECFQRAYTINKYDKELEKMMHLNTR